MVAPCDTSLAAQSNSHIGVSGMLMAVQVVQTCLISNRLATAYCFYTKLELEPDEQGLQRTADTAMCEALVAAVD